MVTLKKHLNNKEMLCWFQVGTAEKQKCLTFCFPSFFAFAQMSKKANKISVLKIYTRYFGFLTILLKSHSMIKFKLLTKIALNWSSWVIGCTAVWSAWLVTLKLMSQSLHLVFNTSHLIFEAWTHWVEFVVNNRMVRLCNIDLAFAHFAAFFIFPQIFFSSFSFHTLKFGIFKLLE